MQSPWVEIVLILVLVLLGIAISIPLIWIGRSDRAYKIRIFFIRKLMWPLVILYSLFGHLKFEEFWSLIGIACTIWGLDRFCKWADRKVSDDHPDKYY